jgi:hypothetical protein
VTGRVGDDGSGRDAIVSRFGVCRSPTEVYLRHLLADAGDDPGRAVVVGDADWLDADRGEVVVDERESSATTRVGVPEIVSDPSVLLTVRCLAARGPAGRVERLVAVRAASPRLVTTSAPSVRRSSAAPIRFFTIAPFLSE